MKKEDIDNIFQTFIAEHAETDAIEFSPLLEKHPDIKNELERKILAYKKIMGILTSEENASNNQGLSKKIIGGCRIIKMLGQGGMGVVYLGHQEKLDRNVVIKLLRAFASDNEALKERFKRESRVIARLNHNNIVPIYDVGEEDGSLYIIMKFIDGIPLNTLIKKIGTIDRALVKINDINKIFSDYFKKEINFDYKSATEFFCNIVIKITDALQHAHDNSVVHRDIKPSNIILEQDGNPILLDFGLSHDDIEKNITLSGDFLGTPIYSAPEALLSRKEKNLNLLDIYSTGVTLYELLTGKLPYKGDSIYDVCSNIKTKEPIKIKSYWKQAPRDLEIIINTAISKEPKLRYKTAKDFGEDLKRFLNYSPIQAKPPSSVKKSYYFIKRKRIALAILLIIFVLLTIISTLLLYNRHIEKMNPERAKSLINEAKKNASLHNHEKAAEQLQLAYNIDPNNPASLVDLGMQFYELEKYNEAIELFEKAKSLTKIDINAKFNLATSLGYTNDYKKAETVYIEIINDIGPNTDPYTALLGEVYENLGYLYIKLKTPNKAIESINKAIQIDGSSKLRYYGLSYSYFDIGNYKDCEEFSLKVLDLDKFDVKARQSLLNLYKTTKQEKKYKEFYERQRVVGGEIYSNEKYKIEFRAPFLWIQNDNPTVAAIVKFIKSDTNIYPLPTVVLLVLDNVQSINEVYDKLDAIIGKDFVRDRKQSPIQYSQVSSLTSTSLFLFKDMRLKHIEEIIYSNGKAFVLISSAPEKYFNEFIEDFKVSLNSFKLLE